MQSHRIGRAALFVLALAAGVVCVVGLSPGFALGAKVLVVDQFGEAPAVTGETVTTFIETDFHTGEGTDGEATCFGEDFASHLGKNPAGTAKVTGSDHDLGVKTCVNESLVFTNGGLSFKQLSVASSGPVKASLVSTVETEAGCKYEVKKLEGGPQTWGMLFASPTLLGTAKIQKHTGSPPSCAKTVPVSAVLAIYREVDGELDYWDAELN